MTKSIGQLASEIFTLLEKQSPENNVKVLASVSTLLDIKSPILSSPGPTITIPTTGGINNNTSGQTLNTVTTNAKALFDEKLPQNKGEEFAVAAYFRQTTGLGDANTRDTLKDIIKNQAKRTFDDKNYNRDIKNAKRQAGFFISGNAKGEYMLSSAGEAYVAALPDRVAAAAAKKSSKPAKTKKKKLSKKK